MARILAIANQKGGVGKTTTAINLSTSLAVAEKRTLLVDIDPQSNSTSGLGFARNEITTSIYDVLLGSVPAAAAVIKTEIAYLHLLPAHIDLVGAEIELVTQKRREFRLKDALDTLRNDYDYVIIDCPPSLGLLVINALVAADSLIIPIQCEYYALEGLSMLLNTVGLVQKHLNPHLEIQGVLLTMYDSRLTLSRQVAENARKHFREKVFETVIARNVRLSEAPSFGKPILLYDVESSGARNYLRLAQEVLSR